MRMVIGVVGGHGGVGASNFAAVLAEVAGATLIDLDSLGGGIDVLLGIEDAPGARWSALTLGGGALDSNALLAALPRWNDIAVLAADAEIDQGQLAQVLTAAQEHGPVVLDLPRTDAGLREDAGRRCDLIVVLAVAEVRCLVALRTLVRALPDVPVGLVLRPGAVPTVDARRYIAAPLLGVLRLRDTQSGSARPKAARRIAEGIVEGLRR